MVMMVARMAMLPIMPRTVKMVAMNASAIMAVGWDAGWMKDGIDDGCGSYSGWLC